ncbi:MAG: hypothetical protein ACTHU0_02820 [Kofleriaceae bacterium]
MSVRALAVFAVLLGAGPAARAERPAIRVAVLCEAPGRTKACPTFLLAALDANRVLLGSPRADADVLLYATANEIALVDRIHLRFVGRMAGAPPLVELDVDLDTRATDDEQRIALEPVFLRGIALFVGARYPEAVETKLRTPANLAVASPAGSGFGIALSLSSSGNYTEKYRTATGEASLVAKYIGARFRTLGAVAVSGGIDEQPALVLDDGTIASLDSTQWAIHAGGEAVRSLDDTWSIGMSSYSTFEDPKGQYDYNWRTRVAIEWDLFPSNDPRGNRLGIFYHLGWVMDRYNLRNELGERFAQYPLHGIDAVGSVRHDHVSYGLTLSSDVQVNHPSRRHLLTATPFVTFQLGAHVDLNLTLSITQRHLPRPDPAAIDPSDYEQLSRLSYAEPLVLGGTIGLTLHWDPTNGVRNNRLESI